MSRLTGADAYGLMEAYQAVYAPQELTEEQVWEEVENWVNSLLEEGYDLSEYTWEDMYESYLSEAIGQPGSAGYVNWQDRNSGQVRSGYKSSSDGKLYKNYNDALAAKNSRMKGLAVQQGIERTFRAGGAPAPAARPAAGAPAPAARPAAGAPAPAARPAAGAPAPAGAPSKLAPTKPTAAAQTGDKAKDMATFAKANPGLAAAAAEKARIRGTQQTDNPLMKSMRSRLPMNSPSVQAPAVAGLGKGNQSLSQNPNAFKAAPPKPVATSTAPEVKATNTIAAKTTPTPVTPKAPTLGSKKPGSMVVSHFDPFDVIKGHLLDEGYADTEESALAIMANMSEEWRQSIVEAVDPDYTGPSQDPLSRASRAIGSAVKFAMGQQGAEVRAKQKGIPGNVFVKQSGPFSTKNVPTKGSFISDTEMKRRGQSTKPMGPIGQ
jgi:hypothetical protein